MVAPVGMTYYERWVFDEGRGLGPLTAASAAKVHVAGGSYVAVLGVEHLVITLRGQTRSVGLAFLSRAAETYGAITWRWPLPGGASALAAVNVLGDGGAVWRLERDPREPAVSVVRAPFTEPKTFAIVPRLATVNFPIFGRYAELAALPRNPWAYLQLPPGFRPPPPGGQ